MSAVAFRCYFCKKCQEGFLINQLDPDVHLLKKVMGCPNSAACEGKQLQVKAKEYTKYSLTKISALKFYQACLGVGLPGERKCGVEDMKKLLVGATVVGIRLDPAPDPNRSVVWSLDLDNGKTVHLASSSHGATFYKVTQNTEVRNGR